MRFAFTEFHVAWILESEAGVEEVQSSASDVLCLGDPSLDDGGESIRPDGLGVLKGYGMFG